MKSTIFAASVLLAGLALASPLPKPDTPKPPANQCPLGQHSEPNHWSPGGPPICIPDGAIQ
ncbi:hypothetical protein ISF_05959 [Cordyceps fumosorosea ARSEF 2679]|uniref:Uncharacterized protein n=1 Tax=Cordyceps fumosorosea (strain ARSEF 2679) TaxID=1081104 RepID=A0A167SUX3_CORFA|nr:hypothetical protein ISF_05959 [Cordyceps fumosorosea ARSEF 2679]OAA59948.1 hypothetical protein ISF_05959 [Cordyceps fumosorosea ARSEF 2679]